MIPAVCEGRTKDDKGIAMRAKLHEFAKGWMELARNLIVASVLLALARRSQNWLVTLFAYATMLIFVGHYLTYVLDAIVQMELPRSWRPYLGKWVLGSAFMVIVVIALVYTVVEIFSGLFDVIVPLHIPAR
jgi:hypothetical protein